MIGFDGIVRIGDIHLTGLCWERGCGPAAGVYYPKSAGEFQSWFVTDADCLDYLDCLRWPEGFVCPRCGHAGGWAVADGRYKCAGCGGRTSVTAGTLFDRRRTPLTVWFTACWMFATGKDGMSALSVQRALEIGSYPTAWAMLHQLRSVLVRPGRERLTGMVEVDETFIGGEEAGLRGGRARGKKVLTGIAVEVAPPKGMGRCRMAPLADASAASLHAFVTDHIEPGATVITDAWQGYCGLEELGYIHDRRSQRAARARGQDPGELLPRCTGSPHWPSGGCSVPTRARWSPPTCSVSYPHHPENGDTHRAWTARERYDHGEPLAWASPVR
ncbi:MAG: IS1595 family transposase [Pseudonocardiaceae bacterium]